MTDITYVKQNQVCPYRRIVNVYVPPFLTKSSIHRGGYVDDKISVFVKYKVKFK